MAINDIYEAKVYCKCIDQISINVSHYRVNAQAGTGATLPQMAAALASNFAAPFKALLSANADFSAVSLQLIRPLPIGVAQFSTSGAGAGTVVGDTMPRQVAGIFTLTTPFGGRSFRGRKYVPFPGEADGSALAVPTAGYMTRLDALATAYQNFLSAGVGGNTSELVPVIFSKTINTSTNITGYTLRSKWATQRRRGSFGATNELPI